MKIVRRKLRRISPTTDATRWSNASPALRNNGDFTRLLNRKLDHHRLGRSTANAARLLKSRFRFLHCERLLPDPVDWRLGGRPGVSHLWRFHLHYHEFLLDLITAATSSGDKRYLDRAWQLVRQWIDGNQLGQAGVFDDAWHPFCISRRLPVWMVLWSAASPPADLTERFLGSLYAQARFLEQHLEWDVRGNHLLENAKALVMAGAFASGPDADRWLQKGTTILENELSNQILEHGEHFERSPGYQTQVLESVLDVADVAETLVPELSRSCRSVACRMAGFLRDVLHPDGQIPLLGDSSLNDGCKATNLIRTALNGYSKPRPNAVIEGQSDGGKRVGEYWAYRRDDDLFLFDCGPVGADELPAHAHCDLLSIEVSINGKRLIVDSGVFNYEDDAMRRYCRSTSAHNVLQIDHCEQCDMWSRFRMGYRGWPSEMATGETHEFHWARAHHNAYRRIAVPVVGRWVACRAGGPWICVDWARGTGVKDLTNWLHFHPDVDVSLERDQLRLKIDGRVMWLRYLSHGRLDLVSGWYCPDFGVRLRAPVAMWTARMPLPTFCGWYLSWDGSGGSVELRSAGSDVVNVHWDERHEQLNLQEIDAAKGISRQEPARHHDARH